MIIYRSSHPYSCVLGQVPDVPGAYSDIQQHPENKTIPGLLIFQLGTRLYFANAKLMRERLRTLIKASVPPTQVVLIDMVYNHNLDITSAEMLENLIEEFHKDGIEIATTLMHEPFQQMACRCGLMEKIGKDHIFPSIDTAVQFFVDEGKIGAHETIAEQQ
jgi:SulP family sulfate permease